MTALSHQIALKILQEALLLLGHWSEANLPYEEVVAIAPEGKAAIDIAKDLTKWPSDFEPQVLQLVFDAISLKERNSQPHYWPVWTISNIDNPEEPAKDSPKIPFPTTTPAPQKLTDLQTEIKQTLRALSSEDWGNFALLLLILEKYSPHISFGEPDVALFDRVRATAAVASSLGNTPNAENLCLVAGDLSGIQSFIYTISSDGALKSLRARSFYLELAAEEMTQQLLERLELPRTNVIYTGGGKSFLLAPATASTQAVIRELKAEFNQELFKQFQGKVFLNLAGADFSTHLVGEPDFNHVWEAVNKTLAAQKARKFDTQIEDLLAPQAAHEPCRVCHRDDLTPDRLKPLGGDGAQACPTCNQMFRLGQRLYQVKSCVRSHLKEIPDANTLTAPICIKLGEQAVYYHLFRGAKPYFSKSHAAAETVYLINNWDVTLYQTPYFTNPTLLLLGNYGQSVEAEEQGEHYSTFISAADMADRAQGIKRVGHLRMDVDRLGQIFAQGLEERYTLPRLAGLSRQMSYFFKVYLNSLAEERQQNFLDHQSTYGWQNLSKNKRDNLLFIYAGGDDLFVTGAWNELVEFAFDVYQSFRAYTGHHPDITLSGGISLSGPKYPLYQSAEDAGYAEGAAKANDRDSLSLFGQVFKWHAWLGDQGKPVSRIQAILPETQSYIGGDPTLDLFGIFPFVAKLQPLLGKAYPQSFVRNLLSTAQVQEQFIKRLKKTDKSTVDQAKEIRDIQYFLHLPKVAYTLARLPKEIQKAEGFESVRTSLKSPYNAPYFRAIAIWLDLLNRSSLN